MKANRDTIKNHYAVYHLAAMHTLPCTLAICAGMAAAQLGMFVLHMRGWDATAYGACSYATLIDWAQFGCLFRIALALMGALLLLLHHDLFGKSSPAFLVHRLPICPAQVGLGWACNSAACLLMLWGVEVLVLWGCYLIFCVQSSTLHWGSHTFLAESYRNGFLHAVLPMGDWVLWLRNLLALAALSLASGYAALRQWRGKRTVLGSFALLLLLFFFDSAGTYSAYDILLIVAFGCIALFASVQLRGTGRDT